MVRPVKNLLYGRKEWIGTLEQVGFVYFLHKVPGTKFYRGILCQKHYFEKCLLKELRMGHREIVLKS